jgi:hypothetical protein
MHSSNSSSYLHMHAQGTLNFVDHSLSIQLQHKPPRNSSIAVAREAIQFKAKHARHMFLVAAAAAGSGSDTEQQIFHLLHQDKSRLLGLMPPKPAAAADVAQLTTELAGLSDSLLQQQQQQQGSSDSSSNTEGGAELIIANGVWTKGIPVHEQYAAKMLQLFKVSWAEVWRSLLSAAVSHAAAAPQYAWY